MPESNQLPCNDAAVKARTGRNWSEWCAILDADNADGLSHRELAARIEQLHDAGGWWSQTVAVGYERLRGKRAVGQQSGGTFAASASKTLPFAAAQVHTYFTDAPKRARWLEDPVSIRTATAPKSVRMQWPDATHVDVWITGKGDTKCSVAVQHTKLANRPTVEDRKAFWRAALQRLGEALKANIGGE
jgi:hypothetical protein